MQGDARQTLAAMPTPDKAATESFVASVFPDANFGDPSGADLSCTYVRGDTVIAGCFPGLRILGASEVAIDRPSRLPSKFIAAQGTTLLHAMHSVVDWFAFAIWEDGVLRRSLSVSPDNGVIEDVGERFAFETPYWDGAHPAVDPQEESGSYPLAFHPLELGEATLREFLGFELEGYVDPALLKPEHIAMFKFEPSKSTPVLLDAKPWWKFW
ncbi:MAG: hypothetical protein IPK20_16380 [Betaproteobacteria bacterium]|nr:hypothetical protein [Betaproteobacteria bacterium]